MASKTHIPESRRERNPLITSAGFRRLNEMLQHTDAPQWNYVVGDRVERKDLKSVDDTRAAVRGLRRAGTGKPPESILEWLSNMRPRVPLFSEKVPADFDLDRRWADLPTMSRIDFVRRLEDMVPEDADLSRLIVYDTSGTTGHAIHVPHHPRAMAENHAFMEFVLEQHGVRLKFGPDMVACINVGAQLNTVVFATVFSVWKQAGFVKVNLHPRVWTPEQARRFFAELDPAFLTGDPLGFAEMLRWKIECKPAAMTSTAVTLLPGLACRLEEAYGCPVIDTYASTETGPIAYTAPDGNGLSILPHDIYVEIVDDDGVPVPEGEHGEICVTGGRNPYVPLLRYRTGDFGRMRWSDIVGPDPTPRIIELDAREAVAFTAHDGTVVSPVDIGRIIREWIFVQHRFTQNEDRSCELVLQPAPGCPVNVDRMRELLEELFGPGIPVSVTLDETLGQDR